MGQILEFRKVPGSDTVGENSDNSSVGFSKLYVAVKAILVFLWIVLRLPIFLFFYWLRAPITFVCNMVSVITLLALIFCWFAFPMPRMLWTFGIISFTTFVIVWTYDYILMILSPQPMMRTL